MNRIRVALNPPRRVHEFCTFARAIAACVSEDPLLSPPPSLLATLGTKLVALDTALVAVDATRRRGDREEGAAARGARVAAAAAGLRPVARQHAPRERGRGGRPPRRDGM